MIFVCMIDVKNGNLALENCNMDFQEVSIFRDIILQGGLTADEEKVDQIKELRQPKS